MCQSRLVIISDSLIEALQFGLRVRLADFPVPLDILVTHTLTKKWVAVYHRQSHAKLYLWMIDQSLPGRVAMLTSKDSIVCELADPNMPDMIEHTAQFLYNYCSDIGEHLFQTTEPI